MNIGEYAASQANRFEFFSGVPVDSTQTRQLFFNSADERDAYFDNLPKYASVDNAKYIRRTGTLKAQIPPTTYVNYMRFKNTGLAMSKWFYAFVNRIDYLNPTTSTVSWTLDVYQTFIHEVNFRDCDITRETRSATLSQKDNVLPEGIDYGDYRILTLKKVVDMKVSAYLVISTVDLAQSGRTGSGNPILQSWGGSIYNNAPSCCEMILCRTKEKFVALMNHFQEFPWVAQCVQAVYGIPSFMLNGLVTSNITIGGQTYERVNSTPDATSTVVSVGNLFPMKQQGGLMPDYKFRKLWQYPYTFFEVVAPDGSSKILKPELYENGVLSVRVTLWSIISPEPEILVMFPNYEATDVFSSLSVVGFPQYPVPNDQYYARQHTMNKQYALSRAQAAENLRIGAQYINTNLMYSEAHNVVDLAGHAIGMLDPTSWTAGGITGHAMGAAHTAITSQEAWVQAQQQKETMNRMEQQAAERERLAIDQNQTAVTLAGRTNAGAMPVLNAIGYTDITFRVWTITEKAAERLDKYFDTFGLKVNRIGQPNFWRGKRYHYVKMATVNLYGNIPQDYLIQLQNIFLNGITLWKDHNNVGVYGDNEDL